MIIDIHFWGKEQVADWEWSIAHLSLKSFVILTMEKSSNIPAWGVNIASSFKAIVERSSTLLGDINQKHSFLLLDYLLIETWKGTFQAAEWKLSIMIPTSDYEQFLFAITID